MIIILIIILLIIDYLFCLLLFLIKFFAVINFYINKKLKIKKYGTIIEIIGEHFCQNWDKNINFIHILQMLILGNCKI